MVQKRSLVTEVGNNSPQNQATRPRNQRLKYSKSWLQNYSAQLENFIRKAVREEVEQAIQRVLPTNSRLLPNQADTVESRKFKLQFDGKFPDRLFTGNRVVAEGPSPIKVSLLDALSGNVITDNILSDAKVKIVILQGHFKVEQLDDWTQWEFNANIVSERVGKRPLIVGECIISLRNGICFIDDICITDNSCWVKSKQFRLGVMIEGKQDLVKEGVSSSFGVKDRRGEVYQKHKILSPEDEVWRLPGIAKDGKLSRKLAEHQIYKVKDLVAQYHSDKSLLRRILDLPPKKWETVIQMATSSSFLPQFCAPPRIQDQPLIQISQSLAMEHNQEPSECPALFVDNNSLLADILAASCDDGCDWSFGYTMQPCSPTGPLHEQDMFYAQASSWPPSDVQSYWEQSNDFVMGCSSNSDAGLLSSISSDILKPKGGWSKLRAVWRILVQHDEATLKKGKFPCYKSVH